MPRLFIALGLLLLVQGTLAATDSAKPSEDQTADPAERSTFSASDVFNLEYAADPQISPDGKTIVYARRSMDRQTDRSTGSLWTLDVASGRHRPLLQDETVNAGPRFSPSGDRLLYLANTAGKPTIRVLYLDTGRSVALGQFDRAPGAPVWSPDGQRIAFSMFVPATPPSFSKPIKPPKAAQWSKPARVFDNLQFRFDGRGYLEKGATHVFVVPAEGGSPRQLTSGAAPFQSPAWLDNDSLLVVGYDHPDRELDPIESEIYRVDVATKERTLLISRDGPDAAPKVSPGGDLIAYMGFDDQRKAQQQLDLYIAHRDGSNPRNLTADYDRGLTAVQWRGDGKALIAMAETDGELSLLSIPLRGTPTVLTDRVGGTSLGRPYGAGQFSVAAKSGARPAIAYTHASSDRPAEVGYLRGAGKERVLTQLNEDALGHLELAPIEEFTVASSHDERPIEAWVALPPGFEAEASYPMVLEIHGGPFAMYGPFFAAEIQRFAAEGYVTVYVNPRGSTGYGDDFVQEIDLAYPGNDYDDLMSVVDDLIARRYVDPKRLFVTGGSGGGILTAHIVTQTDRFAAAASVKPVINWTTMALASDIAGLVARHWMRAMPWENRERYWNLSPISRADKVVTPTLMMVGEEDYRTPTWEAEQFYTALKLQNVDTALIRIPGSSHSIAARPSRLNSKVDNIIGWFRKYDPKQEEPSTAQ